MLTEKELEAAIQKIVGRIGKVNRLLIKRIAEQITAIGELNATSVHQILVMTDFSKDIQEVTRELAKATRMNIRDVYRIYNAALNDTYTDPRFREALKAKPLTPAQNARIVQLAQNVATQTAKTMKNLSNTTAVSETYRNAVDEAIMAVSTGGISYTEAKRDIIRQMGGNGLKVVYESGYRRRLDSAVRQNIIDGVKQINQNTSLAMGEELGYDAVEISAHANSAPDHEPVQGRVFLKAEFEKMQNGFDFRDVDGNFYEGFRRPIAEWNCMHIAMGFSTKHSIRRYKDDQLQKWKDDNAKGCEIEGKHYTMYEARQLMRQIETKVRYQKDAANAARELGDDVVRRECQRNINALAAKYAQVAKISGLAMRKERMSVEGFRMVKPLKNAAGQTIIEVKKNTIRAEPNSITQTKSEKGGINRNYYGPDGRQTKQISNHDHGNAKEHPYGKHGEHAHDYVYDDEGHLVDRPTRELTDEERSENGDIL